MKGRIEIAGSACRQIYLSLYLPLSHDDGGYSDGGDDGGDGDGGDDGGITTTNTR